VAAAAEINRETLRLIRQGTGQIRPLTMDGIEDALQWRRGSIDAILSGGDPTPKRMFPVDGPNEPMTPMERELLARIEALEDELRSIRAERRGERS
jgi:hypothetical protein